jgi:NIPSNAP protein
MVRARVVAQARYGHFADYLKAAEQLNEIARQRGWTEATFWVPTVGTANELVLEIDYSDLATFERESHAQASDSEWMGVIRGGIDYVVEGSVRSELFETAPELA